MLGLIREIGAKKGALLSVRFVPPTQTLHIMSHEILNSLDGTLPDKLNHLVACRVCALVKDRQMFEASGCNNCTQIEPTIWNAADVAEMTTSMFSGYVNNSILFYLDDKSLTF